TPLDLGMGRMVSNARDFIGRRSLRRPAMTRPDRKQLVGLLPQQQAKVLPEGTQLVVDAVAVRSGLMLKPQQAQVSGNHSRSIGYITSSYFSATLGRAFALGLIENGRARIGSTIFAAVHSGTVPMLVTESAFYDKQGSRRNG